MDTGSEPDAAGRGTQGSPGDRGAGKRLRALGGAADQERDPDRRRTAAAMIDMAITDIEPLVGTLPACRALAASRAGVYRRRRPPRAREPCRRPTPARALSEPEQAAVLEQLHSPRFVDASPAEVWATLLDEGTYLASERTMYRLLAADGPLVLVHISRFAADESFVRFDLAGEFVDSAHGQGMADAMIHKPSGFLSHAD